MSQNVDRLWHSCSWWTYFYWKRSDYNFGTWRFKLED